MYLSKIQISFASKEDTYPFFFFLNSDLHLGRCRSFFFFFYYVALEQFYFIFYIYVSLQKIKILLQIQYDKIEIDA